MAFEIRDSYAMGINNVLYMFLAKDFYISKVNFFVHYGNRPRGGGGSHWLE